MENFTALGFLLSILLFCWASIDNIKLVKKQFEMIDQLLMELRKAILENQDLKSELKIVRGANKLLTQELDDFHKKAK